MVTRSPAKTATRRVVGRRFTRRHSDEGLLELLPADYFNPTRAKAEALARLAALGYSKDRLYGPDGECHALDVVRRDFDEGETPDHPAWYPALVLRHVREFELCREAGQGYWKRAAAHAYAIGRFVALAHVYGVDEKDIRKRVQRARRRNTTYTDEQRARWRAAAQEMRDELSIRDKARLVVGMEGLPEGAFESVRKELMKKSGST